MKIYFLILNLLLLGISYSLSAQHIHGGDPLPDDNHAMLHAHQHKTSDIPFIQNLNQWEEQVKFKAYLGTMNTVFLEDQTLTYVFSHSKDVDKVHDLMYASKEDAEKHSVRQHAYKVHFLEACKTDLNGFGKQKAYHNYIIGNDPSKWASYVPLFNKVVYNDLYEDIRLETYSKEGLFKYDFIVQPGADVQQIKMRYEGTDGLEIDNGNLVIHTSVQTIMEQQPYAYQTINGQQREVKCHYILNDDVVSFEFPEGFDTEHELIIDPVVVAATLSGSVGAGNFGHTATFDNGGNIYAGGISFGLGYPATLGAFQTNFNGGYSDIAVSKYNPDGSNLIFATYIGGSDRDYPHSMITDFDQQLYIYGSSTSPNYPVTPNAVQTSLSGVLTSDIIVTKLNSSGTALVGSTYMGGTGNDGRNLSDLNNNYGDEFRGEIIIDSQGNAYVASMSSSSNFPVTSGAFDTNYNSIGQGVAPAQDGVVFKLNSDFSTLFWSTFLGEDQSDAALGLRLDNTNNVYVTGVAGSSSFPTTPGAVQPTWLGGEEDAFVVLLSANGSNLMRSTFWGSAGDDHSYFIDVDEDGNVHIYGQTTGSMPVTPSGTYFFNANSKQFLTSFSGDLGSIVYSTVIGTGNNPFGYDYVPVAFMVDKCNNIYFSGYYANFGLPVTPDAISTQGDNFYLGVLEPEASGFSFGTYYGDANHVDGGTSRFDKSGTVYQGVCSCTQPSAGIMNTLPNAHATTQSTFCDIGVFKIDFEINTVTAAATASPATSGCAPFAVDFTYTGQDATQFEWDFNDNGSSSTLENPNHTFTDAGDYEIRLIASAAGTCNEADTFYLVINVLDGTSTMTEVIICDENETTYLDATTTNASYEWQDGSSGATFSTNSQGVYWVDVTIQGCTRRDSFIVALSNQLSVNLGPDFSVCDQSLTTLDATTTGAVSYLWGNGFTNPVLTVQNSGTYTIEVFDSEGCPKRDTVEVLFGTTPSIDLGQDVTLCDGEIYTLDATTPGVSYQWPDGSTDPTFVVSSPGTYWVIIDNNGCEATDSVQVNYLAELNLALNSQDVDCDGDCNGSINVSASGGNGNLSFLWNTGSTSTNLDELCPGAYDLTITDNLCSYVNTIVINEPEPLGYNIQSIDVECPGEGDGMIEVVEIIGGTSPFLYSFNGEPFTSSNQISNLSGGYYEVVISDANGCTATEFVNIYEPPAIVLDAGPDLEIELGERIQIRANVFPFTNQEIEWTPSDSLSCLGCIQPYANPTRTTTYTIAVIDSTTGCTLRDDVLVKVEKNRNVFIPNIFTPNGDGTNDIFQIFTGNGVRRVLKFQIFDRWGEVVYAASNFEPGENKFGWDGTFKGEEMNNAVFVYFAEIEFEDDVVFIYKGDFTLVK